MATSYDPNNFQNWQGLTGLTSFIKGPDGKPFNLGATLLGKAIGAFAPDNSAGQPVVPPATPDQTGVPQAAIPPSSMPGTPTNTAPQAASSAMQGNGIISKWSNYFLGVQ